MILHTAGTTLSVIDNRTEQLLIRKICDVISQIGSYWYNHTLGSPGSGTQPGTGVDFVDARRPRDANLSFKYFSKLSRH